MAHGQRHTCRFYRLQRDMDIPQLCLYRFNVRTAEDAKLFLGLREGKPLADTKPIRLEMRYPERAAQDIALASDAEVPILSPRAAEVFKSAAGADVQLLPADIDGRDGFSVLNVTTKINCIDWDESTVTYDKKTNRPITIMEAVIREDLAGPTSIIRILPSFIMVSDSLRRAIHGAGLTGASFQPLKSHRN